MVVLTEAPTNEDLDRRIAKRDSQPGSRRRSDNVPGKLVNKLIEHQSTQASLVHAGERLSVLPHNGQLRRREAGGCTLHSPLAALFHARSSGACGLRFKVWHTIDPLRRVPRSEEGGGLGR